MNVLWNGTKEEFAILGTAIEHNCECDKNQNCGAHSWLKSQKDLDRLLYVYRYRAHYINVENSYVRFKTV